MDDWRKWINVELRKQHTELEIWRERFPLVARSIREEAAAKVEGREPSWPAPVGILKAAE